MALLMTPTLFNSIDWYENCPPSWKKKAYGQLLDMLNRKWTSNKAVERGMAYEKELCHGENPIDKVSPDLHDKFKKAYDMIHAEGHDFQAKAKKIIEVDGKEFCLYGKIDDYFAQDPEAPIIDIKTTGSYKGKASYLKTWQHKIYCYIKKRKNFLYIVYEFDNDTGLLIDIHFVEYTVTDFAELEKEVIDKVKSVRKLLSSTEELKKAYLKKFNLYN